MASAQPIPMGIGFPPGLPPGMGGAPQQGPTQQLAETSPENPSQYSPETPEYFSLGQVSEADQKETVDTIAEYRNSWAQDRLERIRQWMENLFYWKGIQCIKWDNSSGSWYDVLAWSRSQGEDGEDTDLERWINPLVLMFCNVFTATMSRAVPEPIVKPRNADPSLKDTVTAKAATEALRIIKRQNQNRKMNRTIYELLFLFGSYFRYTRPAINGRMFGFDEVPIFEDMMIASGPHYTCPSCGTETPADGGGDGGVAGMTCPKCGAWMGQESYYAAGEGSRMSLKQTGTKKIPRAGVKQTLINCLEFDMDPKATGDNPMTQTAIASYDTEIDFGEACRMFPKFRQRIQPGEEVPTTSNASIEKQSRLDLVSVNGGMTADNSMGNPTYSVNWVTPGAYYKRKNWEYAARMEKMFPDGLLLTMVGTVVVDMRPAVLEKDITSCALYTNQGVYCNALANTAVSFNARFNRVMWILDDWATRAALGLNVVDASRIDAEKMSGKRLSGGTLTSIPMKFDGQRIPIQEVFAHFELPVNPALWNYPMMLMTFAELILGIPRQLSGQGTQDDVETLGGQQLQLARAATTLKPYFENVKDEDAQASQNAVEHLQALMKSGAVKEITEVIESNGGAFQNNRVDYTQMEGNVNIEADEEQDLPVSPEELTNAIQMMFKELTAGNPAAIKWFDVSANQDLAQSKLVPGSVVPDEAQRLKTEADIQTLIEQPPLPTLGPNGQQGTELPVHPGKMENFPVAKDILQRYVLEHYELRIENPVAWQSLYQYWDELSDGDMKVAEEKAARQLQVTKAGQPPPPQPDPSLMAEMQQLLQVAGPAITRLLQISGMDPMLTKGTATAQVAAGKEIIEATVEGAKLVAGGK
jgi:hypothetical protein